MSSSEGVEIGIGMETDKSESGGSVYGLTNFRFIWIGNYDF